MTQVFSSRMAKRIAVLVVVVFCLLIPAWVRSPYYLGLMMTIMVYSILAMSFVLMLRTGLIHMGVVAFWGLGAYSAAIMMTKWGLSFWVTLPLSAIICGLAGLGTGYILIGRGRGGLSFVILSAVMGMLFPVLMASIGYLGGHPGISGIPVPGSIHIPGLPVIDFTTAQAKFYLCAGILLVVIVISWLFYRAWTGRVWNAIGMNPQLAGAVGINVFRYRLVAVTLASAFLGMAGVFTAVNAGSVTPANYGMWTNIYVQVYAVLGGLGFPILGPLVGAGVMVSIPQVLQFSSTTAPLMMGVVLILLVLFFPDGILGILHGGLSAKKGLKRVRSWIGRNSGRGGEPPGPASSSRAPVDQVDPVWEDPVWETDVSSGAVIEKGDHEQRLA